MTQNDWIWNHKAGDEVSRPELEEVLSGLRLQLRRAVVLHLDLVAILESVLPLLLGMF